MNAERIELLEQYLDDGITATGLKRLLELIRTDGEFRKEFADALRMRGLLHAGVGPDASCEQLAEIVHVAIPTGGRRLESRVMEKIQERGLQPRRDRSRWMSGRWAKVAVGVAAGWALALVVWIVYHQPPGPQLVALSPDVGIERDGGRLPASIGTVLKLGDTLSVPSTGFAWIRYGDGTTVQAGAGSSVTVEGQGLPPDQKRLRVSRGFVFAEVAPQAADRPMILVSPHAESKILGTRFSLSVEKDSTKLLVREGKIAFAKKVDGEASIEVRGGQVATAAKGRPLVAESLRGDLLRRLGKTQFMLGVMSGVGEKWIPETREQGCRWDLRYQHLVPSWTQWNGQGVFATMYVEESERMGVLPVFTYYSILRTPPAKLEQGVGAEIARVCGDTKTMQKYFADLRLFFQKAGATGKPVILHVEPGLWAQFLTAPEFRPNTLDKVKVVVKSAGLPELEALDDSAVSFGKAFAILRDRHAPNVLLAWHVSKVDGLSPAAAAEALSGCGTWDLLFTDVGDRDAGYKESRGVAGAWWKEKDFTEFREWGAEVYKRTGLPIMVWRIPLGNTYMATCNNTPWHYMDNRVEYWLENYPANRHIAEWADAGFIGLLFGGGTTDCTVQRDNAKDGVTNPTPVQGNKGEQSTFTDDDGGYLRLRVGKYYQSGPVPLSGN